MRRRVSPSVTDGAKEIVGGIITDKKSNIQRITRQWHFSHSRTSSAVWKSSYSRAITRKTAAMMQTDARVFIQGRVSAEDDKPSKLICEKIFPFAGIPKEL